jgi:hypothetical protein
VSTKLSDLIRTCKVCGVGFQRISHGKYCSPRCTKIAGRVLSKSKNTLHILKCTLCLAPHASSDADAKLCFECKKINVSRNDSAKVISRKSSNDDQLACYGCTNWVETPGADLGFSCKIGYFLKCKPYLPQVEPLFPKVNN